MVKLAEVNVERRRQLASIARARGRVRIADKIEAGGAISDELFTQLTGRTGRKRLKTFIEKGITRTKAKEAEREGRKFLARRIATERKEIRQERIAEQKQQTETQIKKAIQSEEQRRRQSLSQAERDRIAQRVRQRQREDFTREEQVAQASLTPEGRREVRQFIAEQEQQEKQSIPVSELQERFTESQIEGGFSDAGRRPSGFRPQRQFPARPPFAPIGKTPEFTGVDVTATLQAIPEEQRRQRFIQLRREAIRRGDIEFNLGLITKRDIGILEESGALPPGTFIRPLDFTTETRDVKVGKVQRVEGRNLEIRLTTRDIEERDLIAESFEKEGFDVDFDIENGDIILKAKAPEGFKPEGLAEGEDFTIEETIKRPDTTGAFEAAVEIDPQIEEFAKDLFPQGREFGDIFRTDRIERGSAESLSSLAKSTAVGLSAGVPLILEAGEAEAKKLATRFKGLVTGEDVSRQLDRINLEANIQSERIIRETSLEAAQTFTKLEDGQRVRKGPFSQAGEIAIGDVGIIAASELGGFALGGVKEVGKRIIPKIGKSITGRLTATGASRTFPKFLGTATVRPSRISLKVPNAAKSAIKSATAAGKDIAKSGVEVGKVGIIGLPTAAFIGETTRTAQPEVAIPRLVLEAGAIERGFAGFRRGVRAVSPPVTVLGIVEKKPTKVLPEEFLELEAKIRQKKQQNIIRQLSDEGIQVPKKVKPGTLEEILESRGFKVEKKGEDFVLTTEKPPVTDTTVAQRETETVSRLKELSPSRLKESEKVKIKDIEAEFSVIDPRTLEEKPLIQLFEELELKGRGLEVRRIKGKKGEPDFLLIISKDKFKTAKKIKDKDKLIDFLRKEEIQITRTPGAKIIDEQTTLLPFTREDPKLPDDIKFLKPSKNPFSLKKLQQKLKEPIIIGRTVIRPAAIPRKIGNIPKRISDLLKGKKTTENIISEKPPSSGFSAFAGKGTKKDIDFIESSGGGLITIQKPPKTVKKPPKSKPPKESTDITLTPLEIEEPVGRQAFAPIPRPTRERPTAPIDTTATKRPPRIRRERVTPEIQLFDQTKRVEIPEIPKFITEGLTGSRRKGRLAVSPKTQEKQKESPLSRIQQGIDETTIERTASRFRTSTAARTRTATRLEKRLRTSLRQRPPRRIVRRPGIPTRPTIIIPKLPDFDGRKRKGFIPQVRIRGKFTDITDDPLSKSQARKLAEQVVDRTSAASFKLRKSEKPATSRKIKGKRPSGFKFRKAKTLPSATVEKSKFRIDNPTEKVQITEKGLRELAKGQFKKPRKRKRKRSRGQRILDDLFS